MLMAYTAKEIEAVLKDEEYGWSSNINDLACEETLELNGLTFVPESVSGSGGEVVVFSVGNQLFRVVGEYNSWEGCTWNYGRVVEVKAYSTEIVEYLAPSEVTSKHKMVTSLDK
jgi:hypothetical protein